MASQPLRVLDLFSGIGGFSLGLERAGMQTVAFCEIDKFCQKVLKKHWPGVPIYDDVRKLKRKKLEADGIRAVDVICGGFPCQDVSLAGRRAGLKGIHSGLWTEYARIIGELRPEYVIVENTPGLLSLGMARVLGELASLGYDAEWHCIPAYYVGANHIRDRIWIVAYLEGKKLFPEWWRSGSQETLEKNSPNFDSEWKLQPKGMFTYIRRWLGDCSEKTFSTSHSKDLPVLGREVHGIPRRLDRLRTLGNAVVPQIPEIIGRAIMEAEA